MGKTLGEQVVGLKARIARMKSRMDREQCSRYFIARIARLEGHLEYVEGLQAAERTRLHLVKPTDELVDEPTDDCVDETTERLCAEPEEYAKGVLVFWWYAGPWATEIQPGWTACRTDVPLQDDASIERKRGVRRCGAGPATTAP